MVLSKVARSKESFRDKVSSLSESTVANIFFTIDNFENFSMEKYGKVDLIPDLKDASEEELYDVLQNWINWNNTKSASTIQTYFSHLRKYLHYMGIKLNEQDIRAELTFKHKVEEELYGLSIDDVQKIFKEMRYKNKVQYMCQLSSLMRIGEIIQLRKKHLILGQQNIIVKIPPTITKFHKGRTTFFSKEASKLLMSLLKKLDDEDLVFGSSDNKTKTAYQNKVNSQSATKQVLRLAVKNAGLDMTYESTGRYMINTHSFRAYGITKLSRHDPNFAKKIAGQKGYLLQYDRMNDEEKLGVYEEFEIDLIIDTTDKQNAEIKQLKDDKTKLIEMQEQQNKFMETLTDKIIQQGNAEELRKSIIEKTELKSYDSVEIKKKLKK